MRLVIIGCGGMGRYQAKKFTDLGAVIVGAIDHNDDHRAQFCRQFVVAEAYEQYQELVKFIARADAVACALPDPFHVACSELALQSGFAVFCEKPLGTGLQEAKRLEPYAADAIFMVNFSKRSTPAIEAARSVLEAGELGSIEHIEIAYRQGWQQTHAWGDPDEVFRWKWRLMSAFNPYGCLGDLGSHLIDLLRYLFGEVRFEATVEGEVEDEVLLSYRGRFVVQDTIACDLSCAYNDQRWVDALSLKVVGEDGSLILNTDLDRHRVEVTAKDGLPTVVRGVVPLSTYERFLSWVAGGERERPDLGDAIAVQAVLDEVKL